jgi:hypothetical protein
MSTVQEQALRMMRIFAGNTSHYYVADFKNVRVDKNKKIPPYSKRDGAPRVEDFVAHLEGRMGLLVVPVMAGGGCRFGKIDLDEYPADLPALARKVANSGLPLIVERSKSAGAHLGRYLRATGSAKALRDELFEWAVILGCSTKVEIFPKQEQLLEGEDGSGINLPYFGADNAENYAVDENGNPLNVDAWLGRIEGMPDKPAHMPGKVDVEAAADLLAQHWKDGQRDNLNLAAAGAMIRAGVDEAAAQAVLDAAYSAGADTEVRRSVADVARSMDSGKRIPGFTKLSELMGKDAASEFMRLVGGKPPKELLPFTFQPNTRAWREETPPPLTYTLKPLLPSRVVGLVVAEGGAGKSTLLLRMAIAVSSGRPLFVMEPRQGSVVYLAAEDHEDSLRRRYHRQVRRETDRMRDEGLSDEVITQFHTRLDAHFTLRSVVGYELHLVKVFGGQTTQGAVVEELITKLPRPLELLILDPLSRLNGAEENSNTVGTALINAAERIAREVGCTVAIAHHTGKASAHNQDVGMYGSRGASSLVDAARSSIRLIQEDAKSAKPYKFTNATDEMLAAGDLVRVVHNKCNDGPKAKTFWLLRDELDFELFTPQFGADGGATYNDWMQALFTWYTIKSPKGFSQKRLDDGRTRTEAFSPHKLGRNECRALLAEAQDAGDIVEGEESAPHSKTPLLVFRKNFGEGL